MEIAVVDYGMGNIHSTIKSVEYAVSNSPISAKVILAKTPEQVKNADKIIFPGQGAMPDCMKSLKQSGLDEIILESLNNKPFLGICVGAQLLFEFSEEGDTAGLGFFKGRVKRFANNLFDLQQQKLKVPHMGWNTVRQTKSHPLFQGIDNLAHFYFVHSYYFSPQDSEIVLGVSEYPDEFACVVGRDNVFATQFHTEKSGDNGLQLLKNFVSWNGNT